MSWLSESPYEIGLLVVWNNGRCKICCSKGRRSKCIFRATREREHQKEKLCMLRSNKSYSVCAKQLSAVQKLAVKRV